MENKGQPQQPELLTPQTTFQDLQQSVSALITPDDRQKLGDNADDLILGGIISLSPFAPEPNSFDMGAFRAIVAIGIDGTPLSDDNSQTMLEILKAAGLVKPTDKARLMVDKNAHEQINRIGEELENN